MDESDFSGFEIGLIGAAGRMGRWLAEKLMHAGCRVIGADRQDPPEHLARAAAARVVFLAVPAPAVPGVMQTIGPHTDPRGLLTDICSLKAEPLAAMAAQARGAVIGCHPLFGPSVQDASRQVVFLCPQKPGRWAAPLRNFWAGMGARVVEMEPARHDNLMAQVQSMRHLLLVALGQALAENGFDPQRDLDLAGPWFGKLWQALANQFEQPADLYLDIALSNPSAPAAVSALSARLREASEALARADRPALERAFGQAAQFAAGKQNWA